MQEKKDNAVSEYFKMIGHIPRMSGKETMETARIIDDAYRNIKENIIVSKVSVTNPSRKKDFEEFIRYEYYVKDRPYIDNMSDIICDLARKNELPVKINNELCKNEIGITINKTRILAKEICHYQKIIKCEKNKITKGNLRLAASVATRYRVRSHVSDLIQEASIGLMDGVDRFDPNRGVKFSTYACYWIRHRIERFITRANIDISIPVNVRQKMNKIENITKAYVEKHGYNPSTEYIAKNIGISEKRACAIINLNNKKIRSINDPINDESATTYEEYIHDPYDMSPEQIFSENENKTIINKLMNDLDEREFEIIEHRFGINGKEEKTLRQLGEKFEVSRERIRQVQNSALGTLKRHLTVTPLKNECILNQIVDL